MSLVLLFQKRWSAAKFLKEFLFLCWQTNKMWRYGVCVSKSCLLLISLTLTQRKSQAWWIFSCFLCVRTVCLFLTSKQRSATALPKSVNVTVWYSPAVLYQGMCDLIQLINYSAFCMKRCRLLCTTTKNERRMRKYGAVVIKNTAETVCSCTKNQQLLLLLNHISLNDYLYNCSGQLFAHGFFFCVFQGRGERGHWMDGQMCDPEHSSPTQTKRHYIERPLGVCVSEVLSCKFRDLMDESTVVINLPPHWRYRSYVTLYWSDTGTDGV